MLVIAGHVVLKVEGGRLPNTSWPGSGAPPNLRNRWQAWTNPGKYGGPQSREGYDAATAALKCMPTPSATSSMPRSAGGSSQAPPQHMPTNRRRLELPVHPLYRLLPATA